MIERERSGCPPGGHRRRYSWRSWSLTVVLVVLAALLAPDRAGASTPRASSAMKSVADLKALIARMIRVPAGMQSFVPEPIEAKLPGPNLILHWGYPAETHKVQTDDGYVLSLFRVPWGRGGDQTKQSRQVEETKQSRQAEETKQSRQVEETKQPSPVEETKQSSLVDETKQSRQAEETKQSSLVDETKQSRPVVFLQHGLLQTADQWLLRGPGQDLPFLLADLGFDVWMGNFRGCTYCRKHRFLSPRNYKFWDFGWQENALHDLPAMLDYVVAVTGQPNMYYIGHSMGTTSLLALLADRPEYNSRVRAAFLMAPVAYFQHTWGALAAAKNTLSYLATSRLVGEAFPKGSGDACKGALSLCAAVYNAGAGSSPKEFNATLFRVLLGHYPAGSSLGQLLHYLQVMVTGEFKKYDYGPKENLARYGRSKPPLFNLKNVVAPVYLNFAEGDPFSPKLDVQRLAKEVPGVKKMMGVRLKDFGHTDHLYAIHSYDLEYKAMIDVMTER